MYVIWSPFTQVHSSTAIELPVLSIYLPRLHKTSQLSIVVQRT